MMQILLAWLGLADLSASEGDQKIGLGPISQAARDGAYDQIIILSDHSRKKTEQYQGWLLSQSDIPIKIIPASLSSPTDFNDIYQNARKAIQSITKSTSGNLELTYHLSPGTPAMAAVWIILSKTIFPARLIESSKQHGVKTVSFPFDLSAEYLPDLLRRKDDELEQLSLGLPPEAPAFDAIIHRCSDMKRLIARAQKVAPRNVPVLIQGESGTGKELLARAIHHSSLCREGPFIAVNCGAIPEGLVDSELFGHEKGSFTGAAHRRIGHIEAANGGTLFLDEIGELPLAAQVKLLRVLQEKEVLRVGASRSSKVDFRIIAATNRILSREVALKHFREDLFHRLAVAVLEVPPLRSRSGDVGLLIDHLIQEINREMEGQPGHIHKNISAGAKNFLLQQTWPGNIREIRNTILRAVLWSSGSVIDVAAIRDSLLSPRPDEVNNMLNHSLGNDFNIQELSDELIKHYLQRAWRESGGNKTEAARLLGLSNYQTFSNWMKKYGVNK